MSIDKFDPNPILVNINKLKPYWFQDTTASKRLESIVEKGRDITNNEIGLKTPTLKNAQGTCTKILFLVDGTEIQESQLGTKNQDLVIGTQIQNPPTQMENVEDPIWTKICTVGSRIENLLPIKNLCTRIKI